MTRQVRGRYKVIAVVLSAFAILLVAGSANNVFTSTPTSAAVAGEREAPAAAEPSLSAPGPIGSAASPPPRSASASATAGEATRMSTGTALALLATLPVKGRAPKTGYARAAYGSAWTDTDRNGCDTRNDMLRRDLSARRVKAGTRGCVALSGWLTPDPYTAKNVRFVRGGAADVDIDHVVALSDAWQKGSFRWPPRKRLAFANDPLNLLAVSASANRSKGDGDAATWLPANKRYRCSFVARQVAVKAKYELWLTGAERSAIARVLRSCPGQPVPRGTAPTISPVAGSTWTSAPSQQPESPTTTGASARCKDGTLSYSAHRRGTCSSHGGVAEWLKDLPA